MHDVLSVLTDSLTSDDLLRCFIIRRIYPLQTRVHKLCDMSGVYDPTRTIIFGLDKPALRRRVRAIARTTMPDDYVWGRAAGCRKKPLKQVLVSAFRQIPFAPGFCWKSTWLSCNDLFLQLFERQTEEDAMHAGGNFADDFPVPKEMPGEDPDGEDHLAIPLARATAPGKPSTLEAIHIASDDDDEVDCEILDVIDTLPLNCAPPGVPRSTGNVRAPRSPMPVDPVALPRRVGRISSRAISLGDGEVPLLLTQGMICLL